MRSSQLSRSFPPTTRPTIIQQWAQEEVSAQKCIHVKNLIHKNVFVVVVRERRCVGRLQLMHT